MCHGVENFSEVQARMSAYFVSCLVTSGQSQLHAAVHLSAPQKSTGRATVLKWGGLLCMRLADQPTGG